MAYEYIKTLSILLLLFRDSVGNLENCWKSDRESCRIIGAFRAAYSNYSFEMTIDCYSDLDVPSRYNNRFNKITILNLNGCESDKTVNPFKEIVDPKSVQFLTIEMFFIRHLNSSFVETVQNLRTLEMKNNEIVSISDDIFTVFSDLEVLSFVGNISPSFNFTSLQTLENLKKLTIIQPTWTIQFDHLLRIPSIRSLQLTVDAVNSGLTTSKADYNMGSLEEIIITNTLLNLELHQSEPRGILRNVRTINLKNNRITMYPFHYFDLTNLKILNLSGNLLEFVNLSNFTIKSPKLEIFNVSNNKIENLVMDTTDQNLKRLKIIDISHNNLQNIQILNDENNFSSTIQIIVGGNPWSCLFLISRQYLDIFKMFQYENDFSHVNVNGLNCSHDELVPLDLDYSIESWTTASTRRTKIDSTTENSVQTTTTAFIVHREDEFFKESHLIIVIISLIVIVILCVLSFILYFVKKKSPTKREPFYRLARPYLSFKNYETVIDISTRKLPPNDYETPLNYTQPTYTEDPNDDIYEDIPDNPYI